MYKTTEELVVNNAQIASLKNVFQEDGGPIKYSDVANSYDGLDGDFPDDEVKWWPFGHPDFKEEDEFPNLPNAKLGFAVASPILLLKEGKRTISFRFTFETKIKATFSDNRLDDALDILFSGEKEWIPATVLIGGLPTSSSLEDKELTLAVELNEGADAVVPYNKEVLLENFTSANPIARFLFKTDEDAPGYELYSILKNNNLVKITIDVAVNEMQEMILENDLGRLDASKPFLPFGPQPVLGSNLYIGCQEALNKPWNNISIAMEWKDTPFYEGNDENFVQHYIAYRKDHLVSLGKIPTPCPPIHIPILLWTAILLLLTMRILKLP